MSVLYIRDESGKFVPIRTIRGPKGDAGLGIAKVEINDNGELVITYTDGNIVNLGKVSITVNGDGGLVQSVNGKIGEVILNAEDVHARPDTWMPSFEEVGADESGTASTAVSTHNTDTGAHNDLRLELNRVKENLSALLDSTDADLDEYHEIVKYIQANRDLVDNVTINKVNIADIIDNLTTNISNKPLSAAQAVVLKSLIDALETNKLDVSALNSAINTALTQAKESGDFDGKNGVGISKTEIDVDGNLVITYTDGNVVNLGKVVGEDAENPEVTPISEIEASKVVFDEEVTTGYAVGNIKLTNGKGILAEKGATLLQVMKNIWEKANLPRIVQPSVTVVLNDAGSYEAGTYFETLGFTATFNKGSYEYDDDNGVQFQVRDGIGIYSQDNRTPSSIKTSVTNPQKNQRFPALTVTEDTNFVVTSWANHTIGTVPHDSLGGEYPEGQITTTSTSKATSSAIKGYRNAFYGVLTSKEELTNDNIREICWRDGMNQSKENWTNGKSFTISIPKSTEDKPIYRVLIAYPDTLNGLASVLDKNDSNSNIVTGFKLVKDSDGNLLKIGGYNYYNPIAYKVYVMDFANPYDAANTFTVTISTEGE